jgi:hypothetical protein
MKILTSNIIIGKYTFDFVHGIEVTSGWQEQTSKAVIKLPAKLTVNKNELKNVFKKGDSVTIQIGYDGRLNTIFEGFVARVRPKVPLELECEDLMWKLKQIQVNDNAKNETMQSFLERNIPYPIDCFDIELPRYIASKVSAAQLLDKISQDFGLSAFVRAGKIVIGKQYDPSNTTRHIIVLDNNAKSNVVSDNLEYTSKDDVKIKVTAISNLSSGKKIEIELGDPDGESRTLNFFNIQEKDLKAIAEKEMERLQYDGYRGDFVVFGEPFIREGDIVEIRNDQESDKTGTYWTDGVNYKFDMGGIRQEIKPGSRNNG